MAKKIVSLFLPLLLATACAGGQSKTDPQPEPSGAPVTQPQEPAKLEQIQEVAKQPPVEPVKPTPAPKAVAPINSVITWRLKQGKLPKQPTGRVVNRTTIKKTGAAFTETCWNYGQFAIWQSQAANEVGAAEAFVRHASREQTKNLCSKEFAGRSVDLDVSEGFFAGVAGDFVLSDGAEVADGMREFQIFSLDTGKLVFKSAHHPSADFTLVKKGEITSLDFFTKIKVECELALEGELCWKKVLQLNSIKKHTPMPNCKAAFAKAKKENTEPALVTVPARIANLATPTVEIIGGQATCEPEP